MPQPHTYATHDPAALAQRLLQERYQVIGTLTIDAWTSSEPLPFPRRREGVHRTLREGDSWGALFDCAWFRFTGRVPDSAAGQAVVLLLDVNGELLVVDGAGEPVRGLTNQTSTFDPALGKPGKRALPVADPAVGGEPIEVWADAGANDLFGVLQGEGRIAEARIAVVRKPVQDLAYDLEVLADLAQALPEGPRRTRLTAVLHAAVRAWDGSDAGARRARDLLAPVLAEPGGHRVLAYSAIGHAHLDLAWLWPLRESRRKAARTLATVLATQERFPGYRFGISQPQQLQWIAEDHPALFARIRQAVATGRIECQGAMWVESDTNLVSGESLCRQLLYGQRAWQGWFGRRARLCWLPDVFGYSASLPQILREAGVDRFMTIKLSWSKVNRFPHHTFRWRSPDGSEVLAHMPPEGTYNSAALPSSLLKGEKAFADPAVSGRALLPFGIGDGGGGPGEEHLERLARLRDLAGVPTVEQEPAEAFFDRLEADRPRTAAWTGELYLEFHQGTYTSQARMKALNRRLEWALRRTELALVRAWLAGGDPAAWPGDALGRIWKEVLLHQFHDILPGSSIHRVYAEAEARSEALLAELAALAAEADRALPTGVRAVNDLPWSRTSWVASGSGWHRVTVPGLGQTALPAPTLPTDRLVAEPEILDNGHLRVVLAEDGRVRSIRDLDHDREVLSAPGNDLLAFADPGDAWDFPYDYLLRAVERPVLVSRVAGVTGPEAWIEQVLRLGDSTITQRLVLTAGSRRLEFRTDVDWQSRGRMLRVRFPCAVRAESARCEIAIGSIPRPTHQNTSWDAARLEVPAHAWVDLAERDYGVALLNDGRYGHRLDGDVHDLALLRSPSYPDPQADLGRHTVTYALFPHAGDHVVGRVMEEAHDLNAPLRLATGGGGPDLATLLDLDQPGIAVLAVKRSEDGARLVVRLAEVAGGTRTLRLRPARPVRAAWRGTLVEEAQEPLAVEGGVVAVPLTPWCLRTVLLDLA